MKPILFLGLIPYLYLTTTTAAFLGIEQVGTASSLILITLFILKLLADKGKTFSTNVLKEERRIILISFFIIIIRLIFSDFAGINQVVFFMIVPISVSMLVAVEKDSTKIRIKRMLVFLFFIVCALAIYEKIFSINVFPYVAEIEDTYQPFESWMFRSTSLFGHPLMNALVVTTIVGFILTDTYSRNFKIASFLIGFVALLCFNARGAIIVSCLIGAIYFITLIKKQKGLSFGLTALITAILFVIGYLVMYTSLGGRLANQDKVIDGSAQSRLEVLSVFNFVDISDIVWGNPSNNSRILKLLDAAGIENSYVVIVLNYGIVMSIILFIGIFFMFRKHLKLYSLSDKLIIIMSFLLIGSLNNSLASPSAWVILFLSLKVFGPSSILQKPRKRPPKTMDYNLNI